MARNLFRYMTQHLQFMSPNDEIESEEEATSTDQLQEQNEVHREHVRDIPDLHEPMSSFSFSSPKSWLLGEQGALVQLNTPITSPVEESRIAEIPHGSESNLAS